MTGTEHTVVIGAGIGGLAAAAALARTGRRVTVLERAPEIRPVGAGLGVAPNALRGLDLLGIGDAVRALALEGSGGIRRADGRWMIRFDMDLVRRRFGDPLVVLRRSDLVDLLLTALPEGALRTGAEVASVDPGGGRRPAAVRLRGGEEIEADLVVAADGIRSAARRVLFPEHPGTAYSGFTCWRMISRPGPDARPAPAEVWGRGQGAGVLPLKDGSVYAYFMHPAAEGDRGPAGERAEVERLFGGWYAPVPEIIAAAPEDAVIRGDLYRLAAPLPAYHRGRIALLGDAAHAMLPNLGQGACQAIEDAIELAHAVGAPGGPAHRVPDGLARYSAARAPRANGIAAASDTAARTMCMAARPAALRDTALTAIGRAAPGIFYRNFDRTFGWTPPGPPPKGLKGDASRR
ncbi:FAD-dependent monooxygenase [Nocardiopsis potens]|uniref:FAD-dependent monooxygenase n=1 Tax=Nocardiopsis potens TaxID=1246458 RepID=UPI000349D0C4|nr:FAD-dependent monooxygenase [Nocardiopsis potens]